MLLMELELFGNDLGRMQREVSNSVGKVLRRL